MSIRMATDIRKLQAQVEEILARLEALEKAPKPEKKVKNAK